MSIRYRISSPARPSFELFSGRATPTALAVALAPMLRARTLPAETELEFERIHESLRGDTAHDAAAAIAGMLDAPPTVQPVR